MTQEKDNYHAPPLNNTSRITTVSPGFRLEGQDRSPASADKLMESLQQRRWEPRRGRRVESGSVSVELVVATPLLLLLLCIVQFAVWWHANHVAQAAAAQ